jgi:hypothetical protein
MTARSPTHTPCARCGRPFLGGPARRLCRTCREARTRRPRPESPAREAYRQGDADLYRAALRGELD